MEENTLLAIVTGKGGAFSGGKSEQIHVYKRNMKDKPITKQSVFEYAAGLFPIVENIMYSPNLT